MRVLYAGSVVMTTALAAHIAVPRLATAQPSAVQAATAEAATAGIVGAAHAFLATLDTAQRRRVLYAFDDSAQRRRWSNFPTPVVPRGGLSLRQMTPAQRRAALALVATALSPRGYEKVQQIMGADDAYQQIARARGPRGGPPNGGPPNGGPPNGGPPNGGPPNGGPPNGGPPNGGPPNGGPPNGGPPNGGPPNGAPPNGGPPGDPRPGSPPPGNGAPNGGSGQPRGGRGGGQFDPSSLFGRDLYYISILGTPSERAPWMLQYGGHHLALNLTVAGARGVLTPSLTGAQPATYTQDGRTVRPLGAESDKALALLGTLDSAQRAQAVLTYQVADLVLGPGQDGRTIQPEGLKASAMTARQRALLLDVIAEWAGIVHEREAAARMAELRADLDQTYFAWSGPTTGVPGQNITAYYRIQGPHLVIEYAPQRDEPTNHVHTIYRDPTNDYGRALTAAR